MSIHVLTLEALLDLVMVMAASSGRHTVMYANVHVLNTAWADAELRAVLNRATLVYCDGAGVKLGARLLGYRLPERMTGADWVYPFCERSASAGLSLFLLGGAEGVGEAVCGRLRGLYPGLSLAGVHHGYIHDDPKRSAGVVAEINRAAPDVVMVGMGTPVQEKWTSRYRAEIEAPVCWTVGALFDYVAGVVPRGPRWMLDHGLEWLFRLWVEPRRLGRRYLVGNPTFLLRVLRQRLWAGRESLP